MKATKSKRTRATYHHGDLKNALVHSALEEIAEHGMRALSLRSVARAAGVTHGAAYRHFRSKEAILAAIAEAGFRKLTAAMREAAASQTDDPVAMLHATGMAYLEVALTFPEHLQVMFGASGVRDELYPSLKEASTEAYEYLVSVVHLGMESGRLRAPDESVAVLTAWAQVHGLALLLASGKVRPNGQELTDYRPLAAAVLQLCRSGVLAPQASPAVTPAAKPRAKEKGSG